MIEPRAAARLWCSSPTTTRTSSSSSRSASSGRATRSSRRGPATRLFELVLELVPALAVLDVMMPGLDGFEVTREIRRNATTSTMPIILLTAKAQATDVSGGAAAGADEYVKKPFDARDLTGRIDALLGPRLVSSGE